MSKEIPIAYPRKEIPDLNPGIVETVYWLRDQGFDTCDSGDGKTHLMEGDANIPYVAIRVRPEQLVSESHRLFDLVRVQLLKAGINLLEEMSFTGSLDQPLRPYVEASYHPQLQTALLQLWGADDETLGLLPNTIHRWSGWPGAICLDCGIEDEREACIATPECRCASGPGGPTLGPCLVLPQPCRKREAR